MLIVPAMDLKAGVCVHTRQDGDTRQTVVRKNPLAVALDWVERGVRRIHIADLDGYQSGEPQNVNVVRHLREALPEDCFLTVGGGVRNEEHILIWLDTGVDSVVMSSRKIRNGDHLEGLCMEFPEHLLLSIDHNNGTYSGCLSGRYGTSLGTLARGVEQDGLKGLICHHVGPQPGRFGCYESLPAEIDMPVFAASLIKSVEHLESLPNYPLPGLAGVILGQTLFDHGRETSTRGVYATTNTRRSIA